MQAGMKGYPDVNCLSEDENIYLEWKKNRESIFLFPMGPSMGIWAEIKERKMETR
jgi:hypothetical protein